MNKIGIQQGFWDNNWLIDFPAYIEKTAAIGFDIFECITTNIMELPNNQLEVIKKTAQDRGIELTFGSGMPKEYDISSKDAEIRRNGIEYLKRTVEFVAKMGGRVFNGVNYGAWLSGMDPSDTDKTPYVERSIQGLKEIIKTAENLNVVYALEVVNRFEQFLFNTCEEGLYFLKEVNSPNIKLHLDTFHMNIEEDSIGGAIELAGDALGHLHIGENNRKLPGNGHMPWDEIGNALRKINYKHAIVMEPFVTMGGEVGRDLRIWHDLRPSDMGAAAKDALQFVREKLC